MEYLATHPSSDSMTSALSLRACSTSGHDGAKRNLESAGRQASSLASMLSPRDMNMVAIWSDTDGQ
eukprot:121335-Pyramimonas_sp.AAC.1